MPEARACGLLGEEPTHRRRHDAAPSATSLSANPPRARPTGRPLVIFGGSSPDDAVYALDARTGVKAWRFQANPTNKFDADVHTKCEDVKKVRA